MSSIVLFLPFDLVELLEVLEPPEAKVVEIFFFFSDFSVEIETVGFG